MCIVGKERGRRCLPLRVALSLVGRDINVVEKLVLVMAADRADISKLTVATVDFSGLWRYTMAYET